jgi:hypothetical protein
LGKKFSEQQLDDLKEHLRFDNFAKNESVNGESGKEKGFMYSDGHFVRKGDFNKAVYFNKIYL